MSVLGMGLSAIKLTSQTLLVALLLGMTSLIYVLPSNRFFFGITLFALPQVVYRSSLLVFSGCDLAITQSSNRI